MGNLVDMMGCAKGLRLEAWYGAVKEKKLLPPVQACVNPVHGCNLACLCCELATDERDRKAVHMPEGHLVKLMDMLAKWGVKSVVFGAVGEPTLHKELAEAIVVARLNGLDVSVVTNGVRLREDVLDAFAGMCSTVWFKIPAATAESFETVTRRRVFKLVLDSAATLRDRRRDNNKMLLGWLFEITTLNMDETVEACRAARARGFDAFYARPLGAGSYGKRGDAEEMTNGVGREVLDAIAADCEEVGQGEIDVRVECPIPHGGFHQCYAAPLAIHLGADGNVYFCKDRYGDPESVIGTHYPESDAVPEKVWGSEEHMQLLFGDTPYWCEAACSLREYHRMARALVWEDPDPMRQWQLIR